MLGFFKKRQLPELAAVISGNCIPLEEVKDEVFASKAMGDGVAIVPENNEVVAPCDGNLSLVANTGHAFGMVSSDGTEILIHIGIDTVNLNGKGGYINSIPFLCMRVFNIRIVGIVKGDRVGFFGVNLCCIVIVKGCGVCNNKLFSTVGSPVCGILSCINA